MNRYQEMNARHQNEVDAFPIRFAFSDKQFAECMAELGLAPTDTDKVCGLGGGTGGFCRKEDMPALQAMFKRQRRERSEAMLDQQFAYQAFDYELGNHEYSITWDEVEAVEALGLTIEEVDANPMLRQCLNRAKRAQQDVY